MRIQIAHFFLFLTFLSLTLICAQQVQAAISTPRPNTKEIKSSPESQATISGQAATPSAAIIVERIIEKKADITEPKSEVKGKLEGYLASNPVGSLNITNFLSHVIRRAVRKGVPANTIVLILLFPLVAALVAFARHVIGLEGFGIFSPAVIAVVFVATGITAGLIMLAAILLSATLGRILIRKIRLQYLPRMSLILWFVSLGVLSLLALSPYLNLEDLITVSIFPILIMILLTEEFINLQAKTSMRRALSRTLTTLLIAYAGYWLMSTQVLQKFVLLNPEVTVLGAVVADYLLGKFTGLRLLEYKRFKELLNS